MLLSMVGRSRKHPLAGAKWQSIRERNRAGGGGDAERRYPGGFEGMGLAGPDGGGLHPAVLVPRDVGDVVLTGVVVNQANDECPHDLAPPFEQDGAWRAPVSG